MRRESNHGGHRDRYGANTCGSSLLDRGDFYGNCIGHNNAPDYYCDRDDRRGYSAYHAQGMDECDATTTATSHSNRLIRGPVRPILIQEEFQAIMDVMTTSRNGTQPG